MKKNIRLCLILLCLTLLGITFRVILHDFLDKENRESLRNNAATLVNLASAYEAVGEMGQRWSDFHIAVSFTAACSSVSLSFTAWKSSRKTHSPPALVRSPTLSASFSSVVLKLP